MRQFSLFINNEVRGPLSEYDIQDLINQGSVDAETLCAPAGSTEWEPLSNHFTFGSSLKLNRQAAAKTEEETVAQATRLDPEIRQKLLMYGLASAATVDQLTQTQGEIAIQSRESEIRNALLIRKIAGLAALVAVLAITLFLGFSESFVNSGLGWFAKRFAKDDPLIGERQKRFESDLRRFNEVKTEAAAAVFQKPTGGQPARGVLLNRLKTPENKGFKVSGQVDASPLGTQLNKWNIKLDEKLKIYLLPFNIPDTILPKITEQSNVLDIILSPMMSDSAFENLRTEIIRDFPDAQGVPEAPRLRAEIEVIKIADLKTAIDRVEFRARNAEQPTAPDFSKKWASELHTFANKLRDLQSRIRINVDPNARKQRWSEFNQGTGAELAAWVLASGAKEVKVNDDGTFSVEETAKVDTASAPLRVLVTTQINGDTVYLPWGSKYLSARDIHSEEIAKEFFLSKEKYKVVDKPIAGGRRLWIKFRVGNKDMIYERPSPQWFYLSLTRERDTDSILVLVDRQIHSTYAPGDVVPYEVLSKLEVFSKPTESAIPAPLSAAE